MSITSNIALTGTASATGAITRGGNTVLTTTYSPIFCGGFVKINGTKATNIGRVNFNVSTTGTGNYLITYDSSYPSNN